VLMPGTPAEQTQAQDTDLGPIDVHMYTFEGGDVAYLVGYNVFPAAVIDASTPAAILDGARDGQVETVKGTLVNESEITLGTYPGRDLEIQVEGSDGASSLRTRLFMVGDRLYQLVVAGPRARAPHQTRSSSSIRSSLHQDSQSLYNLRNSEKNCGDRSRWNSLCSAPEEGERSIA